MVKLAGLNGGGRSLLRTSLGQRKREFSGLPGFLRILSAKYARDYSILRSKFPFARNGNSIGNFITRLRDLFGKTQHFLQWKMLASRSGGAEPKRQSSVAELQ